MRATMTYSYMHIGFTGTRQGMQPIQKHNLRLVLSALRSPSRPQWFHHGDCVGADAEAHEIARELGFKTHIHPPTISSKRAFCQGDELSEPKSYLTRNRQIVNSVSIMIAAPSSYDWETPSGTRNTFNYAMHKALKGPLPITVLWRDGRQDRYEAKSRYTPAAEEDLGEDLLDWQIEERSATIEP